MPSVDRAPAADAAIRGAGLRITAPRQAVYDALRVHPHASADDVHRWVRTRLDSASMQSVYNVLGDFADAGLVRR
ncbi:MAG: transcriptional repressor, partial [Microbacterium sp.]